MLHDFFMQMERKRFKALLWWMVLEKILVKDCKTLIFLDALFCGVISFAFLHNYNSFFYNTTVIRNKQSLSLIT
jgi:hypothetical protein